MIALLFVLACTPNSSSDTAQLVGECRQLELSATSTFADVVAQDETQCLAVQAVDCGEITSIVHRNDVLFPRRSYYADETLVSAFSGSDQPGECSWTGPRINCGGGTTGPVEISTACVAPAVYETFPNVDVLPYTPTSLDQYAERYPCHGRGQCIDEEGETYTIIAPHRHAVFSSDADAIVYGSTGEPVAFYDQLSSGSEGFTWHGSMIPSCLGAILQPSEACGLNPL